MTDRLPEATGLRGALAHPDSSRRLQAALAAGSTPHDAYVPVLVERCAVEDDFFVRDMLTWALTRHRTELTLPLLTAETSSPVAQARSQALHTLSKIGATSSWAAITEALLTDEDDEVARAAWRAAVVLVPDDSRSALAEVLTGQLGRGEPVVQRSLSRALVELGHAALPALLTAGGSSNAAPARHAAATVRLLRNPELSFEHAIAEATRIDATDYLAGGDEQ